MTVDLWSIDDGKAIVVKKDRCAVAKGVLQCRSNLGRLVCIIWVASKRLIVQNGTSELREVIDEGSVIKNKRIGGGGRAHAMSITNLDSIDGRIAIDH